MQFRLISWNTNDDRRLNGPIGQAYPKLNKFDRYKQIKNILSFNLLDNCTIIGLCELSKESCDDLETWAKKIGYGVITGDYNQSALAFRYCVIYPPIFEAKGTILPLTVSGQFVDDETRPAPDDPEYKQEVLGDNYEKSVLKVQFQLKKFKFTYYLVHFGLRNETRLRQSRRLLEYIQESGPVIIAGDFNSFDMTSSDPVLFTEQIEIFQKAGWKWQTEHFDTTFTAFPYDIVFKYTSEEKETYFQLLDQMKENCSEENISLFKEHCSACYAKYGGNGGPLDHVFTQNFSTEVTVKKEMHSHSDHAMVVGKFLV